MVRIGSRVLVLHPNKNFNLKVGKVIRSYKYDDLALDVKLEGAGIICCTKQEAIPIPYRATKVQIQALKALYA